MDNITAANVDITAANVNVRDINEKTDIKEILLSIDPTLVYKTDFIILDSRYREITEAPDSIIKKFKFTYVPGKQTQTGTVNSGSEIDTIIKMKLHNFTLPIGIENIEGPLTCARLSVAIEELSQQAYYISENVKAHWLLISNDRTIYRWGPPLSTDNPHKMLEFNVQEFSEGEFVFYKPIKKLDVITILFGSPTHPMTYYHDRDTCVILPSSTSVITYISTTTNHQFPTNKKICVSFTGFNKYYPNSNKKMDYLITGRKVFATVIDATNLSISVNLTSVTPTPLSIQIFYEDRLFKIPIEVTYSPKN